MPAKPYQLTVELSPPKGTDTDRIISRAKALCGWVDAINVPDCQRSVLKLSSMVGAHLVQHHAGVPAIWQLTCRDRNLIALQSDLLGGAALGLTRVLALTGDPVQVGDHKDLARQVFHLDSLRLLDLLARLNAGTDATGKALRQNGTCFKVGSALNPTKLYNHAQQQRLKEKLLRGVDFFQTQPVYSVAHAEQLLQVLHQAVKEVQCPMPEVLWGIVPPSSALMAQRMNQTVAGIEIPSHWIDQLEASACPVETSLELCAGLVQRLRGLAEGFHLMPVSLEPRVIEVVQACFPERFPLPVIHPSAVFLDV